MRDEKEGRKKQARSNKQQGKATQHTQGSHFSWEKWAASGGTRTHDTLHSRQSALPLSYQGSSAECIYMIAENKAGKISKYVYSGWRNAVTILDKTRAHTH